MNGLHVTMFRLGRETFRSSYQQQSPPFPPNVSVCPDTHCTDLPMRCKSIAHPLLRLGCWAKAIM